ncbi:heavy metal translocating P-type ATPase [Mycobacterium intracellulare]|uniref:heavy-metal-associated domain-containing protein n=1 Tax=Mycobacterium intracellulare TaxID=1767 RepID=UPI001CD9B878|nr:heavy metal-associated domain-containing protein [Mycobacterium intracellulare]MCA2306068.1 heavy metal translocating P-type ATPase [Mycobacterium intracellulare]MCA2348295.1 heavy metal translocating P-type ATPase [Mycobacterium intracellulare]
MSATVGSVLEISCAACKCAIEVALNPFDGVDGAGVDIAAKQASVDFADAMIETTSSSASPNLAAAWLLNPIIASAGNGSSSVSVVADAPRLMSFDESRTAR